MAHVEKYNASSISGLAIHYERRDGCHLSNKDIDTSRSYLNYNLAGNTQQLKPEQFVRKRVGEVKHINRKDIIVMVDWIVTLPKDVHDKDEDIFFKSVYDFMKSEYGEKNIICAWVHRDETTPHIHVSFVPVIEEDNIEKLNCKKIITRQHLKNFHNRLSSHVALSLGYQVEILNGATVNGNRTIKELKQQEDISLSKAIENIESNIAASNTAIDKAEHPEGNTSVLSKLKSLSHASKSIDELSALNTSLTYDNYHLMGIIDTQKEEIDMYREMPLAKRVKEKEDIISKQNARITILENQYTHKSQEYTNLNSQYTVLERKYTQLINKNNELKEEISILKLEEHYFNEFLDKFKLRDIYNSIRRSFKYGSLIINVKETIAICQKIILAITQCENHNQNKLNKHRQERR